MAPRSRLGRRRRFSRLSGSAGWGPVCTVQAWTWLLATRPSRSRVKTLAATTPLIDSTRTRESRPTSTLTGSSMWKSGSSRDFANQPRTASRPRNTPDGVSYIGHRNGDTNSTAYARIPQIESRAGLLHDAIQSCIDPPDSLRLRGARARASGTTRQYNPIMSRRVSDGHLYGKVALITGAGSGIGRATALAFAR